jgi:hypothetical protein
MRERFDETGEAIGDATGILDNGWTGSHEAGDG